MAGRWKFHGGGRAIIENNKLKSTPSNTSEQLPDQ